MDKLLLNSGQDIPFPIAQLTIHPPKISEIALIGQENFYLGCELLKFSKKNLPAADKKRLSKVSDFDIIISMMNDKNSKVASLRINALQVLSLIFPNYNVKLQKDCLLLIGRDNNEEKKNLNNSNYSQFIEIFTEMLCLNESGESSYDPQGKLAEQIAEKIRQGQKKRAQGKESDNVDILNQYVSILAVGENKSKNELYGYTIYQLFDEFKRFQAKEKYDFQTKALLAGAKMNDEEKAKYWMEEM